MNPERWQKIDGIFQSALELTPDVRAAFINEACAGDDALRHELEVLLAADGKASGFLNEPGYVVAAELLVESASPLWLGKSISHYQIISLLGQGGMGEVYRARDLKLDRTVALKILPADVATDAERLRRFVSEAKAASALNHPHVATIYEIGEADGVRFIAMEYVEGQTLAAKINGAPLAINEIVEIGSQIADALDEAHSKGITHRDIKPANVMLTPREQVKVLDFGLAKITQPQSIDSNVSTLAKTKSGVVMGTVPYMSPEQALGRDVDYRSDIFSLGVVLYEMATGRLPFAGSSTSDTLDRILHAQPDAMARFNYDVPVELERIVRKCLEKERERRYQSARELLVDLKNLKRESAATLLPAVETVPVAKAKRFPRNAILAVSLLLLAGIGLAYFMLRPASLPKIIGSTTLVSDGRLKATNLSSSLLTTLVTDGTRLYFSEIVDGYKLAQVSITGGDAAFIPTPFRNTLVQDIAPNKAELLVLSREAEELDMPLWVLPALGGSPRRLGDVLAHGATYSPDGKEIVYANGNALYRMKSDGTASRQLVTVPGVAYWPRWSPDGSRLRFTVYPNDSSKLSLWEVSPDGANAHPFLPDWNNEAVCCGNWTADGKFYVFQAQQNRTNNIWALREQAGLLQRASREPVQLTVGPINYRAPAVSQDGSRLFVVGEQKRGELVRYDARTQQFVNFLGGLSAEGVSFSKDGAWVAYVTYPGGNLWRSRVDGSERLQLSTSPMIALFPSWSPDGKRIAFYARPMPNQAAKLRLVSANGGSIKQPLSGAEFQANTTWSPDGNTVVFDRVVGTNRQRAIQLLKLDTRQTTQLPASEGLYSARWSPEGRFVAALRLETQALVLYDFTTQKWRELSKMPTAYPSWSGGGKYLYFYSKDQVFRLSISDGKLELVADLKGFRRASGSAGSWMGLTPDDAPLMLRDVGTQDIYALEWQTP